MFKQTLRLMTVLLAVAVLIGTGGVARAYLTPSNPDFVMGNPDAAHMPATYEGDYNATLNPSYIIGPGSVPDYLTNPNWAYSPPLNKFVDPLPLLCIPTAVSNWSNCDGSVGTMAKNIPVAVPDIVSYPGTDYYVLELVEFSEPMHSDLPPTKLRGYRQVGQATYVNGCTDPVLDPTNAGGTNCLPADNVAFLAGEYPAGPQPHYLGPIIVATKDRPVRVKFVNKLPVGPAGKLFVPVDTTIMGAGDFDVAYDPITKQPVIGSGPGSFSQNRAELHLHGGRTPWISDGTPHQWITPAGEAAYTDYLKGVSVENVPDMEDPGAGAQTYYWTNQQSSRLMFYHDHAWGITRVNVYVGEAAGYVIRDATEDALVAGGIIPGLVPGEEIPLVIQDKTFVDATTIKDTDPTWAWGSQPWDGVTSSTAAGFNVMTPVTGDLWWPHVYMPAQNPFDITGIAPMGRWAYGPYFWPATQNEFQPVLNPYYHPACDPANAATPGSLGGFCQPYEIPSTPNPSWGAEAFMDTPVVNGTAYPTLTVEPKAYRLRILNAAHDRFFNLSLFTAAQNTSQTWAEGLGVVGLCDATTTDPSCTEVKMVPAVTHPGYPATWPNDGRPGGVPDFATRGPNWVMIGTEGGFLPQPVVIPPHPVNWNADVTTFNAGNVNTGSLILGPAERADVIVDFSAYAGQTLILYNDAPAPWPALDPHYDYYTDPNLDNTGMGGAGPTLPGVGPNTRTIMQIKVAGAAAPAFDLAALQAAFNPLLAAGDPATGVFRQSQDPIIAGQGNMNAAADPARYEAFAFDDTYELGKFMQDFSAYGNLYNKSFPTVFPYWGIARINDTEIKFVDPALYDPLNPVPSFVTVPLQPKAIQDEQGETFDMFGRMRAGLGLQITNRLPGQVGFVVQTYSDPSTEILEENGIQVWKITHNGVDTHPVHFHLFDVQVLNRVGWDGFIRLPDPTELGWKDTVRISPLEDTIVALKPITPRLPFGVPESVRPLNPATSIGSNVELTPIDPVTGNNRLIANEIVALDWEYVWHCHILSHEENDMMRPVQFNFQEGFAGVPGLNAASLADRVNLTWTDPSPVNFATQTGFGDHSGEIGFIVERCYGLGCTDFAEIGRALANATTFADLTANGAVDSTYRVLAYNAAGATPSLTATGRPTSPTIPTAPISVTAVAGDSSATVSFAAGLDGASPILDYTVTSNPGGFTATGAASPLIVTGLTNGTAYTFTVTARNAVGTSPASAASNSVTPTATRPAAPSGLAAVASVGKVDLSWVDNSSNETKFLLQRASDAGFTVGLVAFNNIAPNATAFTDTTVAGNTSYWYRVRAHNAIGASAWSNVATVTTPATPAPAAPTAMAFVSATNNSISMSWTDNSDVETQFQLQISAVSNRGPWTTVGLTKNTVAAPSTVNYTRTGLPANTTHWFRVRAINATGNSAWSNIITGATLP